MSGSVRFVQKSTGLRGEFEPCALVSSCVIGCSMTGCSGTVVHFVGCCWSSIFCIQCNGCGLFRALVRYSFCAFTFGNKCLTRRSVRAKIGKFRCGKADYASLKETSRTANIETKYFSKSIIFRKNSIFRWKENECLQYRNT